MSVWDDLVGQRPVIEQLKTIVEAGSQTMPQSWLICGPAGSGRSHIARAFAAALESHDHGLSNEPTAVTKAILEGNHPDVYCLQTQAVTISIDEVRSLIEFASNTPETAFWRIIIIEDVDRMLERTTNVLLKEIEEPSERVIWLLCTRSAQAVLPTIRSRTRVVNLSQPSSNEVADYIAGKWGIDLELAQRCSRIALGHIGIARLYAQDDQALAEHDDLVHSITELQRTSDAVVLAGHLVETAESQARREIEQVIAGQEREFRLLNGLNPDERIPAKLRSEFNAIGKKDVVKRLVVRRTRDVLDRYLTVVASVYRDVCVIQQDAEQSSSLVNVEQRLSITQLAARVSAAQAVAVIESVDTARRRLAHNSPPLLVFEALLCSLL